MFRILSLTALSLFIASLAGCSGGADGGVARRQTYKVSGKITMAGKGAADVSVMFTPLDGQPFAQGRTNESGEYSLTTYESGDGAAEGKFKVVLVKIGSGGSGSQGPPSHDAYASGSASPGAHNAKASKAGPDSGGFPVKYTTTADTPLEAQVGNKAETFDFDVQP